MKKIIDILLIAFILLLFYLTKDINTLSLTISFSMYLLFYSIFSTTSIKTKLEKYHNTKQHYSVNKLFQYSLITIILFGMIIVIISSLIGLALNIDNLNIINISMSIALLSIVILKLISEYLDVIGYKKIGTNLVNLYIIAVLIINIILSVLLFKVFKLANTLSFILLYSVGTIVFLLIVILLYILIGRNRKKIIKTREENKINYINELTKIIINNYTLTLSNIISASYSYISIIILYYTLTNKYNYNYELVDTLITNTYFYGIFIIYFIYNFINKKLNINYNNIAKSFNNDINKITRISLNLCILLAVLSVPINNLLFTSDYNILISLIPLLFFYILYNYIMNINIKYLKEKYTVIILLTGLFTKVLFEVPFISSIYRMGHVLTSGSILSTILGLTVSMILSLFFIKNKLKLNLLDNFANILNIIYESIIYTLILVIFTLIVKIEQVGILENILVVIFYLFISFIFFIIKRILASK